MPSRVKTEVVSETIKNDLPSIKSTAYVDVDTREVMSCEVM